ncbi:hypothetical protein F2Q68_00027925 [Brassica cretica]|uniref:Uncharacterized protein n=1 Tax=Brassica cretica TaxID=69181 RepID=A0A8S9IJ60_BRACR|nr:hypothetical protein F2Q68_00027925 [Brassica cretica]
MKKKRKQQGGVLYLDAFNTLITVTETTIASGDDQGCVKVCAVIFSFVFDHFFYSLVGILPNRIIQPIGSHEFPIEDLVLSRMITSFLVAQLMTLWDLEEIIEGSNGNASGAAEDSDSDNEEMDFDKMIPSLPEVPRGKQKVHCQAFMANLLLLAWMNLMHTFLKWNIPKPSSGRTGLWWQPPSGFDSPPCGNYPVSSGHQSGTGFDPAQIKFSGVKWIVA